MRSYESITSTTVKRRSVYFSYFATFLSCLFPPQMCLILSFLCVMDEDDTLSLGKIFQNSPVPCSQKTCVSTLIWQFSHLNCCTTYTRPFLKENECYIAQLCDITYQWFFEIIPLFFSFPILPSYFCFSDTPSMLHTAFWFIWLRGAY